MKFVPSAVSRVAARQILLTQKNSPKMLFAAGVVGVVATAVLSAKATLRLDDVLEEHRSDRTKAAELAEMDTERYGANEYRKDVVQIQIRTTMSVCKLYAPAILVGLATVGCLATSQHILNKRNAALVAAYSALEKGYEEYRERVRNDIGEDRERELRYGVEKTEVEVDGKTKKVKVATRGGSIYAKFFDRENRNWSPHPEYNIMFLRAHQNYWNDRLKAKGHVFLNEVYDDLGFEHSGQGALVGWVWDGARGDGFIDFGIFTDEVGERFFEFVMGREGVWLDFNVDGIIYDRI